MCGIAGIVEWSGTSPDLRVLQAMTDRLRHRGPDGEGHYRHGNFAFGHRRLSIIDVESGKQPMSNEDGTVWVTFNGEIYNFRDLRRELIQRGHIFQTQSDTEVIVHGYEEWGDNVVARLQGMFAFAAVNQRTGRLLLARDHFGIKPLVYYVSRRHLLFASEIKALRAYRGLPLEIDVAAVAEFFEYGYIPAPRTIFRGIHKLQPGHFISTATHTAGPVAQQCYWHLDYSLRDTETNEADAIEAIRHRLQDSVRAQMVSDVPLGAMLSGGIDSSAIVASMAQVSPESIKTFSIGFDDERFSETRFARMVASAHHTDHHEHVVRADIHALLPRLVYHFDEPFADASSVPTYYVCEMARRHVTVSLSGDGGDELFAGYDRYRECMRYSSLDAIPLALRRATLMPISRIHQRGPGSGFLRNCLLNRDDRFVEHMRRQYGRLDSRDVLTNELLGQLSGYVSYGYLRDAFSEDTPDTLHRYLEVDTRTYLPNDILTKVDVTSMMSSLEVRVPFLDHKFAEYVARLPPNLKLRRGVGKYVLKRAMSGIIPNEVLYRRKMGFGVPMRQWVATQLRDMVRGYLLDQSRVSGLLSSKLLRTMVEDNEADPYESRYGGKLWWVLFFEMWYQDLYRASPHDVPR